MTEAVMIDGVRTAIGKFAGVLPSVRPVDLLASTYHALIARSRFAPALLDNVYAGCGNQAGEDNRAVARMAMAPKNVAARLQISRSDQDELAFVSQRHDVAAIDARRCEAQVTAVGIATMNTLWSIDDRLPKARCCIAGLVGPALSREIRS
ncbi:MAG: hypothetical protein OEN20_11355 [Gammaproteobacteria bacterium]|nr:hypothetical protein [Gammaproteobacteria bacterium]